MVEQSVVDYIKKHRKEHDIEALKNALIENGHRKEDVEEAVRLSNAGEPPKKGGSGKKIVIIIIAVCTAIIIMIFVGLPLFAFFTMSSYMETAGSTNFRVSDSYCTGGETGVVVIDNLGDSAIDTSQIQILDASQGNAELSPGSDYTWQDSTIAVGGSGTVRIETGGCGTDGCRYRLVLSGRTQTAGIFC